MSFKEFKLSQTLYGHSLDVRAVTVTTGNDIISGSRDKSAKYWKLNSLTSSYQDVMTYKDQKNFVGSVLYLEPSEEYPDGLVVTGGNDNIILVYKPAEPFATFTFREHTNAVSCLTKCKETNSFLSGSWDATVKYWNINLKSSLQTFTGHAAAVWSVLQLSDGRIVTASADKTIMIWNSNGSKIGTINAHADCVRSLADFPDLNIFVSVSNDASIKLWTYAGENVNTYYGHTSFIYSIARCTKLGEDAFVTSDEDRSIKIWKNGQCVQTIQLPAQSVWTVACLSNGDIVTGSSDGLLRIFTQEENRIASEELLNKFTEEVNALIRQNMKEIGGYKVSDLPGREALYDPGKTAGQNKMIREGGGVVLYTWVEDGDKSHWEKVGEVLGGTEKDDSGKTNFEGKMYDFVFSVDVEDGKPPLKLPYNKGDDPYKAAHAFLQKHMLPAEYLEQVVDFILKNSKEQFVPQNNDYQDPFTGNSRYTPSYGSNQTDMGMNVDPFTGGSSYNTSQTNKVQSSSLAPASSGENFDPFTGGSSYTTSSTTGQFTYFPISSFRSFDIGDPKVVINKLKEFNKSASPNEVSENDLDELIQLCNGETTYNGVELLFKILDWPDNLIFPVLDVVRMGVRHKVINEIICNNNKGIIIEKLLKILMENAMDNNIIVSLRTICNLCLHENGEDLVFENRFEIVENLTSLKTLNKNGQVALATVLLNLVILTVKRNDELGFSVMADVVPDILTKLTDMEAHFRCYVALGTLITSSNKHKEEVKIKINENANFVSTMQLHAISGGHNDLENKRRNCVKQLQVLL